MGDSLDVVRGFSRNVRLAIGNELRLLQSAENPLHARPLKAVGSGVWELKVRDAEGQFRVIYVNRHDRIYVLHAFQKKTQRTPRQDIALARVRLKEL